jgi:transcriptional regulator with XRE-family HTH domain
MTFIERLEILLKEKGISQKSLAEYIGIRNPSISEWKKEGTIPRADIAIKMAEYLNVSVEYLITGTESDNSAAIESIRNHLKNMENDINRLK